jgi:SLA1 homology domain 1, SHD1
MKRAFTLLLCLGLMLPSASARTFTDNSGRKVEAEIVAVENDNIRIRRADGQIFTLPLATLSAADQTFVQQWQAKTPASTPAAPSKDTEAEQRRMLQILEDCVLAKWHEGTALRWQALPTLRLNSKDPELGKLAENTFKEVCSITGLQAAPGELIAEIHIGPHELTRHQRKEWDECA